MSRERSRDRRAVSNQADSQRLERIEQALDVIAVEVERLGEHQRFIARSMQHSSLPPKSASDDYRVSTPH
jgi:hypothetical protein